VTDPQSAQGTGKRRRLAALALLALAPWAAECSWGGFTAVEVPFVVVVLAPMYGGAAVLIRETARRTGGGWPTIVLLAAAFGVVQAGLVDRSLFNPTYLDDTEFAAGAVEARRTLVPLLRFSADNAIAYISGHVALSICAPIAIVESFARPPRHRPWLGAPGLIVAGVLYLLGSMMIYFDENDGGIAYPLTPMQLGTTWLVVLALVGTALLPRWRRRAAAAAPGPGVRAGISGTCWPPGERPSRSPRPPRTSSPTTRRHRRPRLWSATSSTPSSRSRCSVAPRGGCAARPHRSSEAALEPDPDVLGERLVAGERVADPRGELGPPLRRHLLDRHGGQQPADEPVERQLGVVLDG
jgi:hypothetical protein